MLEIPTSRVTVISEPDLAAIFVDGENSNLETPETFFVHLGSHKITLKKKNYADYSFCCEIVDGETFEKTAKLTKPTDEPIPTGGFAITSQPSRAMVFVDTIDSKKLTPEKLILSQGAHLITLKLGKHDDASFCVEIGEEVLEKHIELTKPQGELTIASKPSAANIWIEKFGEESANTMLLTPQKLFLSPTPAEEPITVTLKREGYSDYSFDIEIEKGQEVEKFAELTKVEEVPPEKTGVKIVSKPTSASIFVASSLTPPPPPEAHLRDETILERDENGNPIKIHGYICYGCPDASFPLLPVGWTLEPPAKPVATGSHGCGPTCHVFEVVIIPAPFTPLSEDTGRITPELIILPQGDYEITLRKEGYEDKTVSVTIEEGKEIEKFVQLTKIEPDEITKSGVRIVSAPSSASIYIGEEDTGKITPELITLDLGDHDITLKKGGYENQTVTVTIEEGKILEKFINLIEIEEDVPPDKSGVRVLSTPTAASIYISGVDTHKITPELIIIDPGTHEITVKKEGYLDKTVSITIEEEEVLEKFIELIKPEEVAKTGVKIITKPTAASIWILGEDIGRITPELILLGPGDYEITVKKEGYVDRIVSISIEEGKIIEKFVELTKIEEVPPEKTGVKVISKPTSASIFVASLTPLAPPEAHLRDETILERDENENPTKIHGFQCFLCPDAPARIVPFGWDLESYSEVEKGSHGCGPTCRVLELTIFSSPIPPSSEATGRITPELIILPPGDYEITLRKEGYEDKTVSVTIEEGKELEKFVQLAKTEEIEKTGVQIISTPSSASIFLGEEQTDTGKITPELVILNPGTHDITIKKGGYENQTATVTIEEGEIREKFIKLIEIEEVTPDESGVKITTKPTAALIFINGSDTGKITPELIILDPGTHEITVKKEGHENKTVSVTIKQEEVLEKFIELTKIEEADKSGVRITSTPTATSIWINGKDTRRITPELIFLDPGTHEITLKKGGYEDRSVSVTIEEGEILEKFVKLIKIEEAARSGVRIVSKPSSASIFIGLAPPSKTPPRPPPCGNYGDVNDDGYVTEADAVMVDKAIVGLITLTPEQLIRADLNVNGRADTGDSLIIRQYATGVIDTFPVCVGSEATGRITPEFISLYPGEHEITLRKEGYEDKTISVTIKEGKELEKFVELKKTEEEEEKTGLKIVSAPSSTSIYIGEEDTGKITPEFLALSPGDYEITLKKEGYEDKTVSVTIEEGKELEKFVELSSTEEKAKKSGVKVTSNPSAALLYVNEEDLERITPDLIALDPGIHTITVKKEGHLDKTISIMIEEGKIIEKFVKLTKSEEDKGELYITSSPSSAEVYVNSDDTHQITPALLSLTPSITPYSITLKRAGYSTVSFDVTVLKGEKIEKFTELLETAGPDNGDPVGELRIESKPDLAEIWVGGSNTDFLTPETLTLTEGDKTIKLKKSGFDNYTFTFEIVAGEKFEKICELTKSTGELFVASSPSRAKIWVGGADTHLITPEKLIISPGNKTIKLTFPGFTDVTFTVTITKGGKIEKFHRFDIPQDAIIDAIYNKAKCMKCDKAPEYDILFADGNLRAWLCDDHCKELVKESSEKINAIRRIDNGRATSKFRENSNPNVLAEFIREARIIPTGICSDNENDLAPVYPSGKEMGEKITLDEVLKHLKSFYRTKPYVSLIGGICNRGSTTGDLDVFIRSAHRDTATEFRIIRMFPKEYWHRFHFIYPSDQESHPGVFTNHMDIYDEKIEAIHSPEIVLMSAAKKVELLKFTFPLIKPLTGRRKMEEYTIDNLISVVNDYWDYSKKIASQRKLDGVHCRADHSKEGEVKIYTEEGNEITDKCPTIVSEFKEICKGHDVILTGELESWRGRTHEPRQLTAAIIHSKGIHEDEETLKLNIFDCLFYDLDIHNEDYSVRLKSLVKIKDSEHIVKAETKIVDNEKDLREAVKYFSSQEGSEGAYLKVFHGFPYLLTGETKENIKFKNCISWDVEIKRADKIKGANAWSYLCIIRDPEGNEVPVGKSYNTSIGRTETEPLQEGDILKISFVNLNKYIDPETKKVWYNMWSPRPLLWREDKKTPDNTLTAEKLVVASTGSIRGKPYPKRYEDDDNGDHGCGKAWEVLFANGMALQYFEKEEDADHFITSGKKDPSWFDFNRKRHTWVKRKLKVPHHCWPVNKKPIEWIASEKDSYNNIPHSPIPSGAELTDGKSEQDAIDPYLTYPDHDKTYKGMVHSHIRGRSVHLDMRLQISKDHMLGWTLYIPKGLSKDPETFAEAKALNEKEIMPIVRETMSDSTKKFNCGPKDELPPIEWGIYEGTVQPGDVGATKHEHGHFIIIDSFEVQFGAKKSYFHEYFCDGKIFNGRIIFRQLKNKKEWKRTDQGEVLTWFCFNALQTPTPYVLSTRAISKKWIPPYGASALPRNIRDKVPEKYRYWKKKDERIRLECRAELVEAIKKGLLKMDAIKKGKAKK